MAGEAVQLYIQKLVSYKKIRETVFGDATAPMENVFYRIGSMHTSSFETTDPEKHTPRPRKGYYDGSVG